MNRATILSIAVTGALSFAGAAFAQPTSAPGRGSNPSGAPGTGNPYARPSDTGETDSATMPSALNQIRRGTQAARERRAAEQARSKYGPAVPAKASDVVAQATVYDLSGDPVGTIEAVDPDGAVVATAVGKVKIPVNALGKNRQGLLVGMSKTDFEAQVSKAYAAPVG